MPNTPTLTIQRTGLLPDTLAGKTAVVTGSGRGIGRETARSFAWLGANVVIAEISLEGMETETIIKEAGGNALYIQTDVSSEESVAALKDRSIMTFGQVDILVNNAALVPFVKVMDMDIPTWDRTMAVNLRGMFLTCKAFLPGMLERGQGTILNFTSLDAMPGLSAYVTTKTGTVGFTQSLAVEVGSQGIRVVGFGPGLVDTPAIRSLAHDLAPEMGITPEEWMKISFNPGYEGIMPADHAGAAAAYLAAVLADEFHGEIVTGSTVLEMAGIISTKQPGAITSPTPERTEQTTEVSQLPDLSQHFQKLIHETEAELNKIPVFLRPIARNGFKNKAGQSIQEWHRTANHLVELAQKIAHEDPGSRENLRAESPKLTGLLQKLTLYYEGVPAETARFTKDTEFLKEVSRIAAERTNFVKTIIDTLGKV
ncbi:MAG: SDR family oxidoreductase [Chloroflexi bacterium]|nr:MAG: SDR family oxidoreductase [Chloroflexota bacterium]